MEFISDGRSGIQFGHRVILKLKRVTSSLLDSSISIPTNSSKLKFNCNTQRDFLRPSTLFSKEKETSEWILENLKEGDVFYDIGANIGIYSLLAATKVGSSGHVYSFEPHIVNFVTLLKNIELNRLESTISPVSCALHNKEEFLDFNYCEMSSGSSTSQFGAVSYDDKTFAPVGRELKAGFSVDYLIEKNFLRPASLIKIDVDGNEFKILEGMRKLLGSDNRPRMVQVEMNILLRQETFDFMSSLGYEVLKKHHTKAGLKKLKEGVSEDEIPYNAIFVPTRS